MPDTNSDDPLNFILAEDFFKSAQEFNGPTRIESVQIARYPAQPPDPIVLERGIALSFDDKTICVIQFVRPTLWRVRYDPTIAELSGYRDENTRTIVQDYLSQLTRQLDREENKFWDTHLDMSGKGHYTFSSIQYNSKEDLKSHSNGTVATTLYLYKNPFRIQAVRVLTAMPDLYPIPKTTPGASVIHQAEKIVWQTSEKTFRWQLIKPIVKNILLDVVKAGPGEFLGFGEQGGTSFLKKPTFMNYYNFDNMLYNQAYNIGPLDDREPLYHSDPYFLDVNSNPAYSNVTATFIDNYSQICIDFAKTNAGRIRLGTRFGGIDVYLMSADNIPEIVRLYTSILGRPRLKPKYILGHHQGCYGYQSQSDIEDVAYQYRAHDIPLDGIHIDVDFQDQYRTFTINPKTFPNSRQMLNGLKNRGFKCCTNITPIISLDGGPDNNDYPTLKDGLEKGYFVVDDRYIEGTSGKVEDVRYICYSGGSRVLIDPKDTSQRPGFGDSYKFQENWNSKYPYHGGVSYGGKFGIAGYYPNLNDPEVRKWWGQQYTYLFDQGLEFVWQDMTTPAIATSYGDMKGFPSRLNLTSDALSASAPKKQPAIEIWALYSYNLHKATFHGLNDLPSRKNKRNFVIGRGSFAGMHRFSGLWTGDNGSTWDFWRISVSQVLSLGLSGVSIAGSDMGGFMPNGNEKFCDPDLLIRWYSGAFLLPWFRNHYVRKNDGKWFQEPYIYTKFINEHPELEATQGWLYRSVEGICRYYVQLRYSLIQLLYDAMFENQINGLPIARSMLMTDILDTSFYNESQEFLDNQYVVRRDLLVAPIMESHTVNNGQRIVYLPLTNNWYPFNLRIDGTLGVALGKAVEGGSMFSFNAYISPNPVDWPYVTPIYIREGGIIPQVGVRQYIGDSGVNPITIHVYPGRDNTYQMYLDDGVSRSSAPKALLQNALTVLFEEPTEHDSDSSANSEYREVSISQVTSVSSRIITIKNPHDNYDAMKDCGPTYTVVVWHNRDTDLKSSSVSIRDENGGYIGSFRTDSTLQATVVTVPVPMGTLSKVVIEVTVQTSK